MINPVMTPICTVKNMAPKMIPIINAIGKVVPSLILRSGELIIVNTVRQMSMKASVAIIVLPTKYRMSGFFHTDIIYDEKSYSKEYRYFCST